MPEIVSIKVSQEHHTEAELIRRYLSDRDGRKWSLKEVNELSISDLRRKLRLRRPKNHVDPT